VYIKIILQNLKNNGRKIVKSIINAKGATPKKKAGGNVTKKKIVKK